MIRDVEPDTFELILNYIYLGKIILSTVNIEWILSAAHLLCLDDLKRGCVDFLLKTLDSVNCLRYWRWAREYEIPSLSEACRNRSCQNFDLVTSVPDLPEAPEIVIRELLMDDNLFVHSEVDVAKMTLRWIEGQGRTEASTFVDLFKQIRWNSVGGMYVRKRLLDHPMQVIFDH